MTAKEYLSQSFWIDVSIGSKLDQLEHLNALATRVTSAFSQVPFSGTRDVHKTEDAIAKIMDLEDEVRKDLEVQMDAKRRIVDVIRSVEMPEYRSLLEKRYLGYKKWEEIAAEMDVSLRTVYRMHGEALKKIHIN